MQVEDVHFATFDAAAISVMIEIDVHIVVSGGIRDGAPADTRTDAQRESLTALLVALVSAFPGSKIVGHRDLSPDLNGDGIIKPNEWIKSCPCFDATKEYQNI